MTSQIMKFADPWKTQQSKYLENKTHFFPLVKKSLSVLQGQCYNQKYFFSKGNL